MAKRYYCTIQSTPAGKIILWGVGHTKKASEVEAHKWVEDYVKYASTDIATIDLVTLPTDKDTYHAVQDPNFNVAADERLHVIDGKLVLTDDFVGTQFSVSHSASCAYRRSGYRLTVLCNCTAKFNGKSFKHWQEMAIEGVVEATVRAAESMDRRSLPAILAKQQLLAIANAVDDEMVERVYQQRDRFQQGMAAALADAGIVVK